MDLSKKSGSPKPWRLVPLLISLAVAGIFLYTWLQPETRSSWDQLDILVFRSLNNILGLGEWSQWFWAICNCRGFDAVSGCILVSILLFGLCCDDTRPPVRAWLSLIVISVAILVTREAITEFYVDKTLAYHRPSPTMTLENTWRLSQLVPDVPCKDSSPWSFPGDHGFILLSLALYVSYWSRGTASQWMWWAALFFVLPRLVSGAHWFTDIAVGSGSMALVSTALLMATPLHDWAVDRLLDFGKLLRGTSRRESPGSLIALPKH